MVFFWSARLARSAFCGRDHVFQLQLVGAVLLLQRGEALDLLASAGGVLVNHRQFVQQVGGVVRRHQSRERVDGAGHVRLAGHGTDGSLEHRTTASAAVPGQPPRWSSLALVDLELLSDAVVLLDDGFEGL